ncbi:amidohydrolase family protein [Actinomycetospora termitidis]|uniref:Amidohydrolase family protein n=1 Tax=Actinomycetospora termitidis TaxID=3053470 RepID=A0ABT7MG70_9PSEU|nr:amidohydrolase family protein [Actinomycetospora sp. Odt1-22]MDL5159666.1 amidohydrolase family protein [Actinomycetospora sp. Odt1-22]
MADTGRIDVHQHLLPRDYVAALERHGIAEAGGRALPDWSPQSALAMMDDHHIATGILSLSTPGTHLGDRAEARDLTTRLNDHHAELVKEHPDRFGMFAAVPLPDVDLALEAIAHADDDLHADGVVLLANHQGTYLGDHAFDPVIDELARRNMVVFIHPAELPAPAVDGIPPFAADFLLDTTRAAYLLVRNGVVDRHPDLRMILSHAGGFVPYASHRMAVAIAGDTGRSPRDVLDDFRAFYYDTALSGSPAALPSLLAFARPDHVLYGSDWPFAPASAVTYFTGGLDEHLTHSPFGQSISATIDHDNAAPLFPRLGLAARVTVADNRLARLRDTVKSSIVRTAVGLIDPARQ